MSDYVKFIDKTLGDMVTRPPQEALQRQLANNEPKCANCKWWGRNAEMDEAGISIAQCNNIMNKYHHLQVVTTDLSVCSHWEQALKNNQ